MNIDTELQVFRDNIEAALNRWVPIDPKTPGGLTEAMRYSLFAGGKRIRPLMLLGAARINAQLLEPYPAAVAIECIHTYSLIHDDLPAMDDSKLRRGLPTNHVKFDEATAILAGDALLTLAFEVIAQAYCDSPGIAIALTQELGRAAGSAQLVGGQFRDLALEKGESEVSLQAINEIENAKTGALFVACLRMGLLTTEYAQSQWEVVTELGQTFGQAFQVIDDILDVVGDEATVGKSLRLDTHNNKATAVTEYGLEGAYKIADELTQKALDHCQALGEGASFLRYLIQKMRKRVN